MNWVEKWLLDYLSKKRLRELFGGYLSWDEWAEAMVKDLVEGE